MGFHWQSSARKNELSKDKSRVDTTVEISGFISRLAVSESSFSLVWIFKSFRGQMYFFFS